MQYKYWISKSPTNGKLYAHFEDAADALRCADHFEGCRLDHFGGYENAYELNQEWFDRIINEFDTVVKQLKRWSAHLHITAPTVVPPAPTQIQIIKKTH